jgi:hypothetical protein
MADQKLSELTAATSAAPADNLYLVKGGASQKLSIANLFADVDTPVKLGSTLTFDETANREVISGAGAVSVTKTVTVLVSPAASGTLTIAPGIEGQIKFIVMVANTTNNTLTLDDTDLGHDTVVFDGQGDTATLMYLNQKWWVVGGTAAVTN